MKKFIIIISLLVIIICIGTFVSANNNIDWKSKLKFLENFNLMQTVNSDNVAKTQTIKMNGEKLKLEYKETRNELNVYVAKNNEKDEYTFKDGKLVVQTDLGVFLEDKALTEIYQAESLIYEVE